MEIGYYELAYDDIEQISRMEREFFSVPWSEASIAHYAEAGNTIFVVARSSDDYLRPETISSGLQLNAIGSELRPNAIGSELQPNAIGSKPRPADAGTLEQAVSHKNPKKVVGYAAVFCAADEGNLVSIGVDSNYREMGIATELLDIAYDMARDRGVASINLEVRESNIPAISLYECEGFEQVGRRPNFYRNPTEDALIYIKTL